MRRIGWGANETVHVEIRVGVWRELPAWMTEASTCAAMSLGPPQLSVAALTELRAVLSGGSTQPSVGGSSDTSQTGKSDETTIKTTHRSVQALPLPRATSAVRPVKARGIAKRAGRAIAGGPGGTSKRERRGKAKRR